MNAVLSEEQASDVADEVVNCFCLILERYLGDDFIVSGQVQEDVFLAVEEILTMNNLVKACEE
jgi:hypothetical protein